jgi:hypothetical protein
MIPNCTLTTACFDLSKYNINSRDKTKTIENMMALLEVPCYLIIFTDNILFEELKNIRNKFKLDHLTHYIVMDVENLDTFKYRDQVKNNRLKYHPTKDERTCAESHLVCSSKFELVLKSIKMNPFNTQKFGWIDSNVGKNFSKICTNYKNNMLLNVLHNSVYDKFQLQILSVCDKNLIKDDRLHEYYSEYRWIVCGCLFITGIEIGEKILNELNEIFIKHTLKGYGHGEEMYYLEILDKYYDNIKRSYGDYYHILNNFMNITIGMEYLFNVTNLYLSYGYYKECIECCEKIIYQYENFEIEIDYSFYFKFLFNSYVSYFYTDRTKAFETVIKMKNLIKEQPKINDVYISNKDFYDKQFSFCQ